MAEDLKSGVNNALREACAQGKLLADRNPECAGTIIETLKNGIKKTSVGKTSIKNRQAK